HREELVTEHGLRLARDVAGDEDVVGDQAVGVEGPAASVAGDTPDADGEPGVLSHSTLRMPPRAITATSISMVEPSKSCTPRSRVPSPVKDLAIAWVRRSTPWSRMISAETRPMTPPSAA